MVRHMIDDFVKSRREWIEKAQKRTGNRPLPPWAQAVFGDGCTVFILGKPCLLHIVPGKKARVDFVALHELLHFFHPDHGPWFHHALESLWPNWRQEKKRLSKGPEAEG